MRTPQIVIWESDGWLARQLRELAAEQRWLVRGVRSAERASQLCRHLQLPTVLLVQFDPVQPTLPSIELIAAVHRHNPDAAIVAVADLKVPDTEQLAWTAALFDLGVRYALFPPLTRPVVEDLVSGLMLATIRRVCGTAATEAPPAGSELAQRPPEGIIDLAAEDPL